MFEMNPVLVRPANEWDRSYITKFGVRVSRTPLSFNRFFGVDVPDEYGVGLPSDAATRVNNDVHTCISVGTLMRSGYNRIREIMSMTESSLPVYPRLIYKDLDVVTARYRNLERNVDILVRDTLNMLGFDRIDACITVLPSPINHIRLSGKEIDVSADVVVEYNAPSGPKSILLIHEDKSISRGAEIHAALPQLVAEALSVYNANKNSEPMMTEQDIYGVTMLGTVPTFYKIPITDELIDIVEAGVPVTTTTCTIKWCSPVVHDVYPTPAHADIIATDEGCFTMYLKSYEALRRLVTRMFEAMRAADRMRESDLSSVE
jgi:hypothetical protein